MLLVDWISIKTNRSFETVLFYFCFAHVVAVGAEALQFAIPEFVLVASMRDDVIGHCSSNNLTVLKVHVAQGMVTQLPSAHTDPTNTPVQVMARSIFKLSWHDKKTATHCCAAAKNSWGFVREKIQQIRK